MGRWHRAAPGDILLCNQSRAEGKVAIMGNEFSRRHFFYGALLAGAVPAGGFGSTPSLKQVGYKSPSEKLNLATIGAGGRAASDIDGCKSENFVAMTDPDEVSASSTFNRYPNVVKYKDFRK